MGSELVERGTERVLWGMGKALSYSARWTHRSGMAALAVTEEERAGRIGRIAARRLLRFPAWAPLLGGFEPYTNLLAKLRQVVVHPEAVREFAYDWRLPVVHNARLLSAAADEHLATWRAHPEHLKAQRAQPDGRHARLVLVAHSMGGLLARALTLIPGIADEVRAVVTLGTPFHGSVKAVEILNTGRGAPLPLPPRLLRDIARTMPGVHDLLPWYRCLVTPEDTVVVPSVNAVTSLGGDEELARRSADLHRRLAAAELPGHRMVMGIAQPTEQSFTLRDGVVRTNRYGFRRHADGKLVSDNFDRPIQVDHGGDGTVYRYAAAIAGTRDIPLAQQHGALPKTQAAIDIARGAVTGTADLGAVLGGGDLGLSVPDAVEAGESWEITVSGTSDPAGVTCVVEDVRHDEQIARPRLVRRRDGGEALAARVTVPEPGLYRVKVAGGGDPVTQLLLAVRKGGESDD